jgi:hypothetical protein
MQGLGLSWTRCRSPGTVSTSVRSALHCIRVRHVRACSHGCPRLCGADGTEDVDGRDKGPALTEKKKALKWPSAESK